MDFIYIEAFETPRKVPFFMNKDKKFLTRKQVAALMQVRPMTVSKWRIRGKIHADFFLNGRPRFTMQAVQKMIDEQNQKKADK